MVGLKGVQSKSTTGFRESTIKEINRVLSKAQNFNHIEVNLMIGNWVCQVVKELDQ